ncbi:hypothetical protein [Photobacterium profundum]
MIVIIIRINSWGRSVNMKNKDFPQPQYLTMFPLSNSSLGG